MVKLTDKQRSALEVLAEAKVTSASDFDRSALEGLVRKGLAVKHSNGRQATYSVTDAGCHAHQEVA